MVGLDGLKGLFQPTRFYDSMTIITFSCLHEQRIFFFKIAPESHVVLVKITEQQLLRIYIYTYGITVNI